MLIAEILKEKAAEKPTYPIYNSGGWIAKAGSCNIGLKPNPFVGTGIILSKGFDVSSVNNKKPIVIKACVSRVFDIKTELVLLYNLKIK
jgi:hypothetical protein